MHIGQYLRRHRLPGAEWGAKPREKVTVKPANSRISQIRQYCALAYALAGAKESRYLHGARCRAFFVSASLGRGLATRLFCVATGRDMLCDGKA